MESVLVAEKGARTPSGPCNKLATHSGVYPAFVQKGIKWSRKEKKISINYYVCIGKGMTFVDPYSSKNQSPIKQFCTVSGPRIF